MVIIFENILRQTPFLFADRGSPYISILGLTPKINEAGINQVCSKYGNIVDIEIKAYYSSEENVKKKRSFIFISFT